MKSEVTFKLWQWLLLVSVIYFLGFMLHAALAAYIDGRETIDDPLRRATGEHEVEITIKGFETFSCNMNYEEGKPIEVMDCTTTELTPDHVG